MKSTLRMQWWSDKGKLVLCFCVLVLGMFLSLTLLADTFDDALEAYQDGKFVKAGELWKKAGEKSNEGGDAFYNVGVMYRDGTGYDKNLGYAAYWFKQSAEKGYVDAMYALGEISYFGGDDYPKNFNAALFWWQKGIDAGDVSSMLKVAGLYIDGRELDRDLIRAQDYLNIAKQSNNPDVGLYWQSLQAAFREHDVQGNRWISKIRPDVFTIEYYSFSQFSDARRFAISNNIERSAVYQTIHGDYVLIGGLFDGVNEAFVVIQALPEELSRLRPRPRSVSVILAELVKPSVYLPQQWITERDPRDYTVVLYGSESRVEALDFIDLFGLSNAAVYNAKDGFFGVVAGVFDSSFEAREVIAQLPDSLKFFQPQPFLFGDLQQQLTEFDEYEQDIISEDDEPFFITYKPPLDFEMKVTDITENLEVDMVEVIAEKKRQLAQQIEAAGFDSSQEIVVEGSQINTAEGSQANTAEGSQLSEHDLDEQVVDDSDANSVMGISSMTVGMVIDLVLDWKQAWVSGDEEKYFDVYMPAYWVDTEASNWVIRRKPVFDSQGQIQIELGNLILNYSSEDEVISVLFNQQYISEALETQMVKTLQLRVIDGELKIVFEQEQEQEQEANVESSR